jgi:Rrf2 family protein
MRLSKRGEYGIRAMIYLADGINPDKPFPILQIKDISKHENIPPKFLGQILLELKNAGLLQSKMGFGGGYYLAKPPFEISLGHIVRVLDGPLAPIRCVSQMAYEPCDCPDEKTCGLRMVMGDVRNAIAGILDNSTLESVSKRVQSARDLYQMMK